MGLDIIAETSYTEYTWVRETVCAKVIIAVSGTSVHLKRNVFKVTQTATTADMNKRH
jgi:hypothetical protein